MLIVYLDILFVVIDPFASKCQFALSHKMRRSVLTDTRVGRPRSDSDLNHPVTKAADRFRHRVLARLIDRDLGDTFSWEATYDGQILWIEELNDAVKRRPHSPRLQELLYIALRVYRAFVDKLEFYPQKDRIEPVCTAPTDLGRRRMSLAGWARVHLLRECRDPTQIPQLPVPEKVKKFLMFDLKDCMFSPRQSKPAAFSHLRATLTTPYPELTRHAYYTLS